MTLSLFNTKPKETYLFFDTETTGLPLSWRAPAKDVANWPRLIQLAWVVYEDGKKVGEKNLIIKPENFDIPESSAAIHGISTERAHKEGILLAEALAHFESDLRRCTHLVAHNISFDEKIIAAEFFRQKKVDLVAVLDSRNKICTKKISTTFCAIPSVNSMSGYKWPRLQELHQKLFGSEFEDDHNAATDVAMTAKCFWELKRLSII